MKFAVTDQLAGQGELMSSTDLPAVIGRPLQFVQPGNGYEVFIADFEVRQLAGTRSYRACRRRSHPALNGAGELGIAANIAHSLEATKLVSDRGQIKIHRYQSGVWTAGNLLFTRADVKNSLARGQRTVLLFLSLVCSTFVSSVGARMGASHVFWWCPKIFWFC